MIRQTLATGLLAGLIGLSGCTLLPESEALVVYQFPQPAPNATSHAGQPLSLSLRVDTPQAGYAYGGPRLMVQTADNQLMSYKGVRWSDPTPTLLREYLAQAFQRQSSLGSVTTDENSLHADVYLGSELRRFQVVDANPPHILVDLHARLVSPDSRRVYVSNGFNIIQPIDSTRIQDVVEGYNQAVQQLAGQLIDWATPQLEAVAGSSSTQQP